MDAQRIVALNIKRLRVLRGFAQDALAFEAKIDRTYVSRLERCMENPTVGVLSKLAEALQCRIVDFFDEEALAEPPPPPLKRGRKPKA
jgi:transcriptional regulator with XRE-family HTH domain